MKVYEEDTGVGLGIGAEIKTKLHVLRIVETEEPKPSYRLEQEKITLFIPKKVDFSKVEKIVQQFLLEIYTMDAVDICRSGSETMPKIGFRYGRVTFRNIFPIGVVCLLTIISVSIQVDEATG